MLGHRELSTEDYADILRRRFWLILTFAPGALLQEIVPDWWPIAAGIALASALLGAAWPGLKAARQDAIEALSYE